MCQLCETYTYYEYNKLIDFVNLSLNHILFESISVDKNAKIFDAVQCDISSTNRFKACNPYYTP